MYSVLGRVFSAGDGFFVSRQVQEDPFEGFLLP